MTPRSVLILGANGRFGLAAAQAFAAAGWTVLAQTRRKAAAGMPSTVRLVRRALSDTGALARDAAGAHVVVYAVNPEYTRWGAEMLPLARAGMDVAQLLGATLMLPGNVYNFGAGMPELLTESTPEQPTTDKGELRCALEAEMAARSELGLRSIVVRAGDFYGGGPGSWLDLVITRSLAKGKLVYPGPLDVPHAWAYLPDLARCFVALADTPGLARASRFHFPGHTLTGRQLLDAVETAAEELGLAPRRPLRRGGMPWALLRLVAWAAPMLREIVKMAYLWRVPHALDGRLLERTIGTLPTTTVDVAMRESLRAMFLADHAARGVAGAGSAAPQR
jgi:nucleoside-diphosphate-sugar epimerase